MTGEALTNIYAAYGSPVHSVGSGHGGGYSTITEGTMVVDQAWFKM